RGQARGLRIAGGRLRMIRDGRIDWGPGRDRHRLGAALSPKMKKWIRNLAIAGVVVGGLLQVFPAKVLGIHTEEIGKNPPERSKLDAPPQVEAILRRACYDCHSNETKWPLYARIAPGS